MKSVLFLFFLVVSASLFAQKKIDPNYRLLEGNGFVQSKNYYLLTLFEEIKEVNELLQRDPELSKVSLDKHEKLSKSLGTCSEAIDCYTSAIKFSDKEINEISQRLIKIYAPTNPLGKLVEEHLIPSGVYYPFTKLAPQEMLVKAWEQDAKGINYTIGVYSEGKAPNYPKIDSTSFNVKDKRYSALVNECTQLVVEESKGLKLFFEPSMNYALRFLELNGRDEAADFEPMVSTVNKAAIENIKKIQWNNYKYTLILVPGAGPDDPAVELSAGGIIRCRLAARKYFDGLAPLIVVSGGRVHPFKTKYSEAFEMKKYLMNTMKVPEKAIIMEPHARHTTTNLRNCARLVFRYGMPFDKPCITSTTKIQSHYITDMVEERCQKELKHIPYKSGKRLSDTEAEFFPLVDALQINPYEPLDP